MTRATDTLRAVACIMAGIVTIDPPLLGGVIGTLAYAGWTLVLIALDEKNR